MYNHQIPASEVFKLLYDNWNTMHSVKSLLQVRAWLESLQAHDHLLLVHLYAAYWNCVPALTLSFGDMKALADDHRNTKHYQTL
jgi:hypothetical protein